MTIVLVLCALLGVLACAVLVRLGQANGRRYGDAMPQRFHLGHVPRLGGAAMFAACSVGWAWLGLSEQVFGVDDGILFDGTLATSWGLVALAGAAPGVVEDLTQRLAPRLRFVSTGLAA